jgi:allantoinase
MPLNSIPPTTTVENLAAKRSAAREQCWTDVAFWGGVIPGNQVRNFHTILLRSTNRVFPGQDQLGPLVDAGIKGFKCFMIESGVEVRTLLSSLAVSVVMIRVGIPMCLRK